MSDYMVTYRAGTPIRFIPISLAGELQVQLEAAIPTGTCFNFSTDEVLALRNLCDIALTHIKTEAQCSGN